MQVADAFGVGRGVRLAVLTCENGDQTAVAGVKVEMALCWHVEVRLLKDEGHTQHPLPKVNRGLPVGADQRDVVYALGLDFLHSHCSCIMPARMGRAHWDHAGRKMIFGRYDAAVYEPGKGCCASMQRALFNPLRRGRDGAGGEQVEGTGKVGGRVGEAALDVDLLAHQVIGR